MIQSRSPHPRPGKRPSLGAPYSVLPFLAALLFFPPTVVAQPARVAEDVSEVFAAIAAAWSGGDAAALVARFAPGRILLRLPGEDASLSQRFSHQQSLLILRHHFDSLVVRRFEFTRTGSSDMPAGKAAAGKAVGLASVSWRQRGSGTTHEGRVLVVLLPSAAGWVIGEIQALP